MAHNRDNPSSPRSSNGGADSFKGTPDTRLTAFSPEDGSSTKSSKILKTLGRPGSTTPSVILPVNSYRGAVPHLDKDPFVTPDHGHATRLSPTASTFNPFAAASSMPSFDRPGAVAAALSADLGLSRHLDVSSSTAVSASEVDNWLAQLDVEGNRRHGSLHVTAGDDHVCIFFADIRDACSVHTSVFRTRTDWKVEYISQRQLPKDDLSREEPAFAKHGQVLVLVGVPPGCGLGTVQAMEAAQMFLESHGRLFAFIRQLTFPDGSFRAVAEFCDASVALSVMANCGKGVVVEGIHLIMSPYNSDSASTSSLTEAMQDFSISKGVSEVEQDAADSATSLPVPTPELRIHQPFTMYPMMFHAPFAPGMPYMLGSFLSGGHTNSGAPMTSVSQPYPVVGSLYHTPPSPAWTAQNSYSPSRQLPGFGRPDARRQNAMRVNRSPYHNVTSHHNHVDINRIRDGIDVRTTIMLRNIPNKVDQAMLKRIIDESSWGKYDFMYLRIDFANDCNVGYAFINFVDPLDIIDFVDARGNQRWNCFKSDKVAEISYATIQGKDCLVQKFRNSSVMLEASHYRPKLYFTSNGPMPELAGQEEPFPDPDNQSKMKRSCENAEHVGLFTPNAGQHFRDEQRRRRSQYDRGTRLAALEEYDYEAAMQHLYDSNSQ